MTTPDRRRMQSQRIERILNELLQPKQFRVTFVYSDEGISFRVDDTAGNILGEAYRPTPVDEIADMSDEAVRERLREITTLTPRLSYSRQG